MSSLQNKTLFITGASRGIGLAIALRAARDGANVVVAAKTVEPHPKLAGTIHETVEAIEACGGRGLAVEMDVRHEDQVERAVARAVEVFDGIDILVNNASAIFLASTLDTPMKRYDLLQAVNVRGTFLTSRACLPHLLEAKNPHVLNLAPPLHFEAKWFAPHLAYSISKFGMSLCVLGLAEEFRDRGVAVNALWPRTVIATAAVENLLGGQKVMERARKPAIVADAAHAILLRPSRECTGGFFLDDDVLRAEGVTDFEQYSVVPGADLIGDLFV